MTFALWLTPLILLLMVVAWLASAQALQALRAHRQCRSDFPILLGKDGDEDD